MVRVWASTSPALLACSWSSTALSNPCYPFCAPPRPCPIGSCSWWSIGMGSMLISGKCGMSIGLDLVGDGVKYPSGKLRSGSTRTKRFVWSLKYEDIQMHISTYFSQPIHTISTVISAPIPTIQSIHPAEPHNLLMQNETTDKQLAQSLFTSKSASYLN